MLLGLLLLFGKNMDAQSLAIENVALSEIQPYANNSRLHSAEQIAAVCASIREFGFTNPILLGAGGVIIAGHGRFEAARALGMTSIPAIRLAHLTKDQERALVIADNKIAEGSTWDEARLREELRALEAAEFDLGLMGFGAKELDDLLAEVEGSSTVDLIGDPDEVPEPEPVHVSRRGDVWILGQHRLICGDSTQEVDVRRVTGGEVDCVWTDPPYNVNYEGSAGKIQNDNMGASQFLAFLTAAFAAGAAVLKPGGPIYVAHADTEGEAFRAAFREAGLKLSGCLVWVKPSLVLGRSDYQWRHEPILYGWKPGAAHDWFAGRAETTVFDLEDDAAPVRAMPDGTVQIDVGDRTLVVSGAGLSIASLDGSVIRFDKPRRSGEHPTMKPVGLIVRMLRNSARPGGIVLDLFGGSGSTLMACELLGMQARLVELDPRFVDVIVRRWEEATGKRAVLEDGRLEFEAVRAARAAEAEEAAA